MICRGKYLWGFFHQYGKWEDYEATWTSALVKNPWKSIIQIRECSKCGKKQRRPL